jgi:D-serine deaminase-like pyridoxal phosphate-dependent protein
VHGDLDTPVVAIDLDVVDRNISRMQARATALGLDFRPHMKTHKLPLLAHRQLEAGAVGVACQKVSEAWVMAASGVGPILITYPLIGEVKWRQAARLAAEFEIEFQVDSEVGVEGLAAHLDPAGETPVWVDCDTGRWRTGVSEPSDALSLAKLIDSRPGLRFGGLITHPAPEEAHAWFAEARSVFGTAGIAIPAMSVGGTPVSFSDAPVFELATELRAGTYIYGDRACIAAGSNTEEQCAMRVHATVVSTPAADRAIIDAGSKVLSSDETDGVRDGTYGHVVGMSEVKVSALTEEHGHLDLSACPGDLELGQVIEVIPNHACVVTNLADEVLLHRSGQTVGAVPVAARGRSR